jgi:uncharacterized protein (TIGR03067 family)
MRTIVCILFAFATAVAALAQAQTPDAEAIRGTWELESMKVDGKVLSAKDAGGLNIVIAADGIMAIDPAKKGEKSPYKLDPSKSPKWITMDQKLTLGNKDSNGKIVQRNVVQKMPGIYQLDGDKLTICWSTKNRPPRFDNRGNVVDSGSSKERPESFEGGPGTLVFILKRAAK